MANFWRDLANGAQAGYQMGRQWKQDQRAEEEYQMRKQEWEQAQADKRSIKDAAAQAGLSAMTGYKVSGEGKDFYVPNEDAAKAFQSAGYSYDPTQRAYQEVSRGGVTMGQYGGTEDPSAAGLMRGYNAGRGERIAAALDAIDPVRAAGLRASQEQLKLAPGAKHLQDNQIEASDRQQRYAAIEEKFHNAVLDGPDALVNFYAGEMPDGRTAKKVPVKGGGFELAVFDDGGKKVGSFGQFKDDRDLQVKAMSKAPSLISKALELQEKAAEKDLWSSTTLQAARIAAGAKAGYTPNFSLAGQLHNGSPVAFDTRTGQLTDASTGKALSSEQVKLFNKVTGDKPGKDPNMVKVKVGGANGEAEIQMPYMQAVNEGFVPPPKAYLAAKANAQKVGAVAEMDAAGNIAYSKDGGAWYSSLADIPSSNKRGLSQAPVAPSEYEVARKARRDEVFDGAIRGLAGVLGGVPNR